MARLCERLCYLLLLCCLGIGFVTPDTQAQPEIKRLHIRSDITYRFATTNVSSTLANPEDTAMEATFMVFLPKSAFITYFEMIIDDKVYPGIVKEKEVAKREYDRAKKRGQSAGQVAQGREQGSFKVSVNVAANSEVYFNLTYQELLQRKFGVYQHVITIQPGQVVEDMKVDVYISESRDITVLKVPASLEEYGNTLDSPENPLATVRRLGSSGAHISYSPSMAQQMMDQVSGISGYLIVEYDVQRDLDAGEIQVSDGYFVHYFAPTGLSPVKKTVLFILDVSSSMSGVRLRQLKQAMKVIIKDLHPDDHFALLTFSDRVNINPYRDGDSQTLMVATPENKQKAKDMVDDFRASGGTNINDALVTGLDYLQSQEAKQDGQDIRTSMVIFLTDGQPSTGITSNAQIIHNAKSANTERYPLFTLAFGEGAELQFLAKLSLQNDAFARQIYLDSDPELQLQGFYNEISTPIMSDIKVTYVGDTINPDSLTADSFHNYFDGTEIIVAGQLKDNSINTLVTQVSGTGALGYMELDMDINVQKTTSHLQRSEASEFTERLWAYLTIKKLMDKMVESDDAEEKQQAKERALELSLKYSFVTPLTSMVVTKPDEDASSDPQEQPSVDKSRGRASHPPAKPAATQSFKKQYMSSSSGRSFVDNDPHFIITMDGLSEGVCFDINGRPGDIYQLLHDGRSGVTVNGKIVGTNKVLPGSKHPKTYIGEVGIIVKNGADTVTVIVSPQKITINGQQFQWKISNELNADGVKIFIDAKKKVVVTINNDIIFSVLRHIIKKKSDLKVDYLGFYIKEGSGLSQHTHGLIGQFIYQSAEVHTTGEEDQAAHPVQLHLTDHAHNKRSVKARLGKRRNMDINAHIQCWFVRNNGDGLIEGPHTDYIVQKLQQYQHAPIVGKSRKRQHHRQTRLPLYDNYK